MRVLVTGARGFIGKYVTNELVNRQHEPIIFDAPHDIRNYDEISDWIDKTDAVIHLAGILGTSETIGDEQRSVSVNIIGTLNVLDAVRDKPVVLIGTGHKGQLNPYAITKGAAEDLALARAAWTGTKVTVVRAFHVYGPGQKVCPPHGTATVRKIIPSFVCRALSGMPIEIWGTGNQEIDLVYAGDVARVLVDSIDGPYGNVVEAGTGIATTVSKCADTIIKALNSTSKIEYHSMRKGEPLDACVVASTPSCQNLWPYRITETIDYYRSTLVQ